MPIVKQFSVRSSPMSFIEYIMNGDKTEDLKYASGLNIIAEPKYAYDSFKRNFERHSGERFFKYSFNDKEEINPKRQVRLHHYVQSFSPEEKITPEEAHRIGMEWAKKAFGTDRMIVCTTHVDKNHIHNHFAVAPYSMSGKHWISNQKTLSEVRKLSDEIALQHGLGIIKNPNKHGGIKYKEWAENRKNTSWKTILRNKIDSLIADESISNVDELLKKLAENDYQVRKGKYISLKAPGQERGIRIFRLGNGYSERDIEYRLHHRDKETSIESIMQKYKGIQVEYALCIRKIEVTVYHREKNPLRHTVRDIQQASNVLTWMYNNGVYSKADANEKLYVLSDKIEKKKSEVDLIDKQLSAMQKVLDDFEIYQNICSKLPDISEEERKEFLRTQYAADYDYDMYSEKIKESKLKKQSTDCELAVLQAEFKQSSLMFNTYERQMQDDFTKILEEVKAEREAAEKAEQERKREYYIEDETAEIEYDLRNSKEER